MNLISRISITLGRQRFFHLQCGSLMSIESNRMAQNMNKLLKGSRKKKWHNSPASTTLVSPKSLSNPLKQHGKNANRRIQVLNKLFMRHITDQMSTGDFADKINGLSIEITKVKIAVDFDFINVYWLSKGNSHDIIVQKVLNKISGPLRHELSQLHLMGQIPLIHFVKDKSHISVLEVQSLLAEADYGEDFVPTDPQHRIKSEFILNTKLDPEIAQKIKNIENEEFEDEEPISDISDNIFGLNRNAIMNNIIQSMNKNKDAWSGNVKEYSNNDFSHISNTVYTDVSDRRKELHEFLRNRRMELKRAEKLKKAIIDEKNILLQNQIEDNEDTEKELNIDIEEDFEEFYENEEK